MLWRTHCALVYQHTLHSPLCLLPNTAFSNHFVFSQGSGKSKSSQTNAERLSRSSFDKCHHTDLSNQRDNTNKYVVVVNGVWICPIVCDGTGSWRTFCHRHRLVFVKGRVCDKGNTCYLHAVGSARLLCLHLFVLRDSARHSVGQHRTSTPVKGQTELPTVSWRLRNKIRVETIGQVIVLLCVVACRTCCPLGCVTCSQRVAILHQCCFAALTLTHSVLMFLSS